MFAQVPLIAGGSCVAAWAVRGPPLRSVAGFQKAKQQKEQAHDEQRVHKLPAAVGPKDTEKPSREQDERSREEHVASGRQPDPPGGVVRLRNGGRCEMSSELRGQWGRSADGITGLESARVT